MKKILTEFIGLLLCFLGLAFQHKYIHESHADHIRIVLSYLIFVFVLNILLNILIFFYQRRKALDFRSYDNIISGFRNIVALLIGIVGVLTFITLLGFNVKEVFGSLSIIAAAIAIISKDYISNIIGGMLIAFSNDVNIGDYIKVGDNKGKVIDMSISMFSLLTDDDDVVIIPNSTVYALELINYTKREIKKTSIEFEVNIEALTSVKLLEDALIEGLSTYKELIQPNSYNLKTVSIKKDYVEFKFQYILDDPNKDLEKEIRKKVIRKVIRIIKNIEPVQTNTDSIGK